MNRVDLLALLEDPALAMRLPPSEAVCVLAQLEGLAAVVRLAATAQSHDKSRAEVNGAAMITPQAAAEIAGLSLAQLYRRRAFRPAMVRVGHRTLRVNEQKLRRILAGIRA